MKSLKQVMAAVVLALAGAVILSAQSYMPPPASDSALAKEERDTQSLMDLQVQSAQANAATQQKLREAQERNASMVTKLYEDLANKVSASQQQPGQPGVDGEPAKPRNVDQAKLKAMDAIAAEDGPEIARMRGLGYIAPGTVADIRLLTEVCSAIPGPVLAQLVTDLWDVDGRFIVIPRGSKLLGTVGAMSGDSEGRGKVVFASFIDPTGREVAIEVPVITANRIGVTGIDGQVDYHWARMLGASAALALISGIAGNNNSAAPTSSNATAQDQMRSNLVQSAGQLGNSFLQRFIQIKPDITLMEGSMAKIIIVRPLISKPWVRIF